MNQRVVEVYESPFSESRIDPVKKRILVVVLGEYSKNGRHYVKKSRVSTKNHINQNKTQVRFDHSDIEPTPIRDVFGHLDEAFLDGPKVKAYFYPLKTCWDFAEGLAESAIPGIGMSVEIDAEIAPQPDDDGNAVVEDVINLVRVAVVSAAATVSNLFESFDNNTDMNKEEKFAAIKKKVDEIRLEQQPGESFQNYFKRRWPDAARANEEWVAKTPEKEREKWLQKVREDEGEVSRDMTKNENKLREEKNQKIREEIDQYLRDFPERGEGGYWAWRFRSPRTGGPGVEEEGLDSVRVYDPSGAREKMKEALNPDLIEQKEKRQKEAEEFAKKVNKQRQRGNSA